MKNVYFTKPLSPSIITGMVMKEINVIVFCILVLNGCATNVKYFEQANTQEQVHDDTVSLFIDAYGSVYPKSGFQTNMDLKFDNNISLYNFALFKSLNCSTVHNSTEMYKFCNIKNESYDYHRKIQHDFWKSRANHIYQQIVGTNKELVFMLHGYNNNFHESKANFDLLKNQVNKYAYPSNREFLFVNIHWDGFKGNPISGAWRKAQGGGPLVGFRLREFFNLLSSKFIQNGERPPNITFLTHSSGAFIVGALFGNPIAALPKLQSPNDKEYNFFRDNRAGQSDKRYKIPHFQSLRIGMIAAATPTTTFNGIDKANKNNASGLLVNNVSLIFSMNKFDFALSKIFQIQNLSLFGATGAGSDKEKYCQYIKTLESRNNVNRVTAVHFEKPKTPWYLPINDHALKDDGYLARKLPVKLFFNAVLNDNDTDEHNLTVSCDGVN